jgi:hypothetical protein
MGSILTPGYLRWDGFKYVLDPTVEIVGPPGPPGPSIPGPPGPAGPAGAFGNAVLVYQPGGTASGNVYTTWASLWAARTQNTQTIDTPMTIVIDDSFQSPATIEAGSLGKSYDLRKNTALIGYRLANNSVGALGIANTPSTVTTPPAFKLPATFILQNPSYFEWLVLNGEDTAGNFQVNAPYTTLDFVAKDVHFIGDTGYLFETPGGTMNFYGSCLSDGNSSSYAFSLVPSTVQTWNFNLYDTTNFAGSSVTSNGTFTGSPALNVNVFSGAAQWNEGTFNLPFVTTFSGGYTLGNWHSGAGGASPGQVLTMVNVSGTPTATWQTPSASGISLENEGIALTGSFTTLNFAGNGVNTSGTAPNALINIAGFTAGGDLSGTTTSQTVIAIQGKSVAVPTTANTYLEYNGTSLVWAAVSGGSGYSTIESIGSTGSPGDTSISRSTINLISGIAAVDTGTAANLYADSHDSGHARRNFAKSWYRRNNSSQAIGTYITLNNQGWISQSPYTGVNATGIATGGGGQSCGAVAILGDYMYFSGQQPQINSADPRLFGVNLKTGQTLVPITGSGTSSNPTPAGGIYQWTTTSTYDWVWDLVPVRMNVNSGGVTGELDLLFSVSKGFIALGYMTNGGATYNPIYQTTLSTGSGSVVSGAPACCIGIGNAIDGPSATGTVVGSVTVPYFAFIGADGNLYIADNTGTVHTADNTTGNYLAIYYDDDGVLWSSHNSGGSPNTAVVKKWRINYSTFTVSAYTVPGTAGGGATANNSISWSTFLATPCGLCSDGKRIWGLSGKQGNSNLHATYVTAIDRTTMERVLTMQITPPTGYTDYGSEFGRIVFDGEAIWVASTCYNSTYSQQVPILYKINPNTGEMLYSSGPITSGFTGLGTNASTISALNMAVSDSGQVYATYCDSGDRYGGLAIVTASGSEQGAHFRNVYLDEFPYGPGGMQAGSATLVNGTVTVNTGITILSTSTTKIVVTVSTASGTTLGAHYKVTNLVAGGPGTGAFTITAIDTSGATVTSDNSTLNYIIAG